MGKSFLGGSEVKVTPPRISRSPFQPTLIARIMAPSATSGKLLHLISFGVFLYALAGLHAPGWWWPIAVFAYFITGCLGQSVTFHRGLAHRSVTFLRPVEILFTLFGTVGGTLSSIAFAGMHRAHHAHADGDKDPHALKKNGWRLLFSAYEFDVDPRFVKDLLRDPFHRFLHRYYTVILALWAGFLFLINPLICIFCFFIPVFFQITISNLGNILTHRYGYRNYDLPDESANNVLITLLAWGEGWHNNHHASPSYWHFGRRWWELDAGAAVISILSRLGLLTIGNAKPIPIAVASAGIGSPSSVCAHPVKPMIYLATTGQPTVGRRS